MATFKVTTIDGQGAKHEESLEAADRSSVYATLKNKNTTVLSIDEVKKTALRSFNIDIPFLSGVKLRDKIIFTRNLAAMLDAGLALSRALTVIEKQTPQKKFKSIIIALNRKISQGMTLSQAMIDYPKVFSNLITSMVKAGEESGSLSQSLRIVATQMENSYNLTRKIRGALMYPAVIVLAMCGIGFFMLTNVVPTLAATFQSFNATLPPQTQLIINLSAFLKDNIILILIAIILVIIGLYFFSRTVFGKRVIAWILLHIPIVGPILKEINSARTSRTLSSLLSAGVDFLIAVRITTDVLQNVYYKEVMAMVEKKVQKGEPIADIFNERPKLYPSFVGEMISVGEETGQLAQMLLGVATFYENDVDQKTKDLSSIIEPVLMIVIGLAVGFFAISIISPIYSLSSVIS
jgi:type IV pilus assembly protein PilC